MTEVITTKEIQKEFIQNLTKKCIDLNLGEFFSFKEIEKANFILEQINLFYNKFYFDYVDNSYSRIFKGDIKYGNFTIKNVMATIEIQTDIGSVNVYIHPQESSQDYSILSLENICKFEIIDNTLILM